MILNFTKTQSVWTHIHTNLHLSYTSIQWLSKTRLLVMLRAGTHAAHTQQRTRLHKSLVRVSFVCASSGPHQVLDGVPSQKALTSEHQQQTEQSNVT